MFHRVAIVDLGLIGGSIGLALHKAKAAQQIMGYDSDKRVADHTHKIRAIDQLCFSLPDAVRGTEFVILT